MSERGYWTHQWFSSRNPITVYYGDTMLDEYAGRFKMLRAEWCMLRHRLRRLFTPSASSR